MDPKLQRYMAYAFGRVNRSDFLRAMDEDFPDELTAKVYSQPHNVWETSVWAQVSNRRLVRRADGHYRMIPASEVLPTDKVCRTICVRASSRFLMMGSSRLK